MTKRRDDLSVEYLRQRFDYDAETGVLRWRPIDPTRKNARTWNTRYGGTPAGRQSGNGHLTVDVDGRRYMVHRVIWALVYGKHPVENIDHINGDPTDNRIVNLREATQSQNRVNSRLRSDNKTGYRGVRVQNGRWAAYIGVNRRFIHLGVFATADAAARAYDAAAKEKYGEFARLNFEQG